MSGKEGRAGSWSTSTAPPGPIGPRQARPASSLVRGSLYIRTYLIERLPLTSLPTYQDLSNLCPQSVPTHLTTRLQYLLLQNWDLMNFPCMSRIFVTIIDLKWCIDNTALFDLSTQTSRPAWGVPRTLRPPYGTTPTHYITASSPSSARKDLQMMRLCDILKNTTSDATHVFRMFLCLDIYNMSTLGTPGPALASLERSWQGREVWENLYEFVEIQTHCIHILFWKTQFGHVAVLKTKTHCADVVFWKTQCVHVASWKTQSLHVGFFKKQIVHVAAFWKSHCVNVSFWKTQYVCAWKHWEAWISVAHVSQPVLKQYKLFVAYFFSLLGVL